LFYRYIQCASTRRCARDARFQPLCKQLLYLRREFLPQLAIELTARGGGEAGVYALHLCVTADALSGLRATD
jgi:hypothetical protein